MPTLALNWSLFQASTSAAGLAASTADNLETTKVSLVVGVSRIRPRCSANRPCPTVLRSSRRLPRHRYAAGRELIAAGSMKPRRGRTAFARTNIICGARGERVKQNHNFCGLTAVKTQRPITRDDEHVVLKFRPRTSAEPPGRRDEPGGRPEVRLAANDLSRYERPHDEPDDFRHRMLANVAAFAFTVALTAIGIWLAMSIADLRKTQDCVLMGRRDCARISVMPHG
jgi:hypothetical protein